MTTSETAEVISALRSVGATYEPEPDRGLVGLSGGEPNADPPVVLARPSREYRRL
jgi:hypothetical protein